jgi:hypothetical protein
MSKQENFYEILQSKFNERDIPVDNKDWQDMKQMLSDARKRKRNFTWVISSLSLVLLCGAGYELYSYLNPPKALIASSTVTRSKDAVTTNVPLPVHSAPTEPEKKITPVTEPKIEKPIVAQPTVTNAPLSTKNQPIVKAKQPTVQGKVGNMPVVANSIPNIIKPITQNTPLPVSKPVVTQPLNEPAPAVAPVPTNKAEVVVKNSPAPEAAQTTPTTASQPTTKKADAITPTNPPAVPSANATPPKPNNATIAASRTDSSKPMVVKVKSDTANKIAMSDNKQPVPAKADSSNQKKMDSSIATTQQTSSLPSLDTMKKQRANILSIVLGGGYGLGWKHGDTAQGNGLFPIIGIDYTRVFSKKWALTTGVHVSALSGMSSAPITIKHTVYDFGYNNSDTTVTTKSLVYATIPLQVEYKFGQKNAIGIGGILSYLITGIGTVQVSNYSYSNPAGTSSEKNQLITLNRYNSWNASVYLLYKRDITTKLSVSVMPYLGLMNIESGITGKDSGIKLLVSYKIL